MLYSAVQKTIDIVSVLILTVLQKKFVGGTHIIVMFKKRINVVIATTL